MEKEQKKLGDESGKIYDEGHRLNDLRSGLKLSKIHSVLHYEDCSTSEPPPGCYHRTTQPFDPSTSFTAAFTVVSGKSVVLWQGTAIRGPRIL